MSDSTCCNGRAARAPPKRSRWSLGLFIRLCPTARCTRTRTSKPRGGLLETDPRADVLCHDCQYLADVVGAIVAGGIRRPRSPLRLHGAILQTRTQLGKEVAGWHSARQSAGESPESRKRHFNVEDGAEDLLRMVARMCGEKQEKR